MIGRLTGQLIEKHPPTLVVDVAGVGYELEAPMSTIYALEQNAAKVSLHTHMVVRDDAIVLFGFASQDERYLFRQLIRISGVGPKLALAILSGISVSEFVETIQAEDASRLTAVPGIGKKTAARLVIEMKDRLDTAVMTTDTTVTLSTEGQAASGQALAEARHALVALGYKQQEASRLLKGVDKSLHSEAMIRQALRQAMR